MQYDSTLHFRKNCSTWADALEFAEGFEYVFCRNCAKPSLVMCTSIEGFCSKKCVVESAVKFFQRILPRLKEVMAAHNRKNMVAYSTILHHWLLSIKEIDFAAQVGVVNGRRGEEYAKIWASVFQVE